ncbi:MAG TPA: cytochrome c [Chloroflexota bacterium]|jgi:cytochrome c oxidase subunit 2
MAVGLAACGNSGGAATSGGGASGGQTYPGNGNAANGQTLFLGAGGCVVCHTVTGTSAAGKIGPDLTHVGTLLTPDQIYTQIADPKQRPAPYAPPIQAGAVMTTNSLSTQQRADLTAWLSSLK